MTTEIPTTGFYWHLHHDVLIEWCSSYEERARYIRTNKPSNEVILRLNLFRPVKKVPKGLLETMRALVRARKSRDMWSERVQKKMTKEVRTSFNASRKRVDVLWNKYRSILDSPETRSLHAEECPGCPWDGGTIFIFRWWNHSLARKARQ